MMQSDAMAAFFARYEWVGDEVEPGVWRATFTTEDEDEFDLFVMVGEAWIHFAVTPLARIDAPELACSLLGALLRLNQQMRLVRVALDEDCDINLVADLPKAGFGYADFALVVDLLVQYTSALAREILRTLDDERYRSPLLPML
jgi:hypothetical protein